MSKSRGVRFHPKALELTRRHAWSDEKRKLLYKCINLRPRITIVDIGCGTGAFTRVVAQGLVSKGGGRIIAFDRNAELLKEARRLAGSQGFSRVISFKRADVTKSIPLPDNFVDRVVCQAFLWLLGDDDRKKVISEMIRVCKRGGLVGVVEGAVTTSVNYVVGEERFNELLRKRNRAYEDCYYRVRGADRWIGYKLPTLFTESGLERIRLDGVPHIELQCDDRIPLEQRIEEHRHYLRYSKELLLKVSKLHGDKNKRNYVENMEPSLTSGGMKWTEILELAKFQQSFNARLLENPQLIGENTSVEAGIVFITTGIKP